MHTPTLEESEQVIPGLPDAEALIESQLRPVALAELLRIRDGIRAAVTELHCLDEIVMTDGHRESLDAALASLAYASENLKATVEAPTPRFDHTYPVRSGAPLMDIYPSEQRKTLIPPPAIHPRIEAYIRVGLVLMIPFLEDEDHPLVKKLRADPDMSEYLDGLLAILHSRVPAQPEAK